MENNIEQPIHTTKCVICKFTRQSKRMKEEFGKEGICWNCWNEALEDRRLKEENLTIEELLSLIRELHPREEPTCPTCNKIL
jgi:hypothetical protein